MKKNGKENRVCNKRFVIMIQSVFLQLNVNFCLYSEPFELILRDLYLQIVVGTRIKKICATVLFLQNSRHGGFCGGRWTFTLVKVQTGYQIDTTSLFMHTLNKSFY